MDNILHGESLYDDLTGEPICPYNSETNIKTLVMCSILKDWSIGDKNISSVSGWLTSVSGWIARDEV